MHNTPGLECLLRAVTSIVEYYAKGYHIDGSIMWHPLPLGEDDIELIGEINMDDGTYGDAFMSLICRCG